MSDIREQIAKLSPEQRKIFLQRLQHEQQPTSPVIQQIPRRADPTQAPLSFAQQRMWLLDQLEPGNPLFTMTPTMRLTGPLDVAALERGLNAIVQRHEALRATVSSIEGRPVQVIVSQLGIALPVTDLRDYPPAERETMAQTLLDAAIEYHFDLATGPLLRARLLRLADDYHILMVTMHHLVSDGWSLGVLIRELVALYVAQTTNRAAALPALPIQYADFASWQRARLQGAFLDAQLSYWRQQLVNVPVLQLPTDYARPAIQAYRSANLQFTISPRLTDGLKALSRRTGTTPFMMQFAAFAVLLGRLSGQTDFCIGSLVANRTQPELEGLIGFFINNLPLRVDLRGQPSAEALLRQVRAVTLGAYDHQDVPFELVLEALNPTRTASHTPLFQTMCVMQNFPRPHQMLPGLVLHPLYTASRRSGFDLTFWFWEEQDGLAGELEYNPTLFAPATIQRVAGQLRTLLTHVVATPDRPISELPLLSAAEQHQLLVEWNATATADADDQCLMTLFERQVARTPDAIALVYETEDEGRRTKDELSGFSLQPSAFSLQPSAFSLQLTYAELSRRANQLANHLQSLGVGPEVCVALCMERSAELVVALLGVLKAGAAYLPLDPAAPAARRARLLEATQVKVLITTGYQDTETGRQADKQRDNLLVSLSPWLGTLVDLRADWPQIARTSPAPPARHTHAEQLLYVIATSGSTGTPKSAGVTQRGFGNLLAWYTTSFRLTARDQVLLLTAFSFDLTQKNLFAPLLVGATVHLAAAGPYDAGALTRQIAAQRISWLNCTPSALYPLVAHAASAGYTQLASLRAVFVGGEPITLARLRDWRVATHGQTVLVNSYGPTECTDVVAAYRLADAAAQGDAPVPIGLPIANVRLLVLDRAQQLVPLGRIGELYVGGRAVGRGYLNDAALTAERFVPNPFVGDKETRRQGDKEIGDVAEPQSAICNLQSAIGTRLYRTGDLVRRRPDGTLVFIGRVDDQVKLRGFRIELDEIATVLSAHPAVRECVVLLREETPGEARLVAYVVTTTRAEDTETRGQGDKQDSDLLVSLSPGLTSQVPSFVSGLRAFLSEHLPEYMLPAAFVFLDSFPLTPSGKLDRRALPAPDQTAAAAHRYVAPSTPVEALLADMWAEVLGLAQVGVHDNFFALGGHSLLATQVLARVQDIFQVELRLRTLFEQPTVVELAVLLEELLVQEIENLTEDEVEDMVSGVID